MVKMCELGWVPARDIYDGFVQNVDRRIPRTWKDEGGG